METRHQQPAAAWGWQGGDTALAVEKKGGGSKQRGAHCSSHRTEAAAGPSGRCSPHSKVLSFVSCPVQPQGQRGRLAAVLSHKLVSLRRALRRSQEGTQELGAGAWGTWRERERGSRAGWALLAWTRDQVDLEMVVGTPNWVKQGGGRVGGLGTAGRGAGVAKAAATRGGKRGAAPAWRRWEVEKGGPVSAGALREAVMGARGRHKGHHRLCKTRNWSCRRSRLRELQHRTRSLLRQRLETLEQLRVLLREEEATASHQLQKAVEKRWSRRPRLRSATSPSPSTSPGLRQHSPGSPRLLHHIQRCLQELQVDKTHRTGSLEHPEVLGGELGTAASEEEWGQPGTRDSPPVTASPKQKRFLVADTPRPSRRKHDCRSRRLL
eukprot:XP_027325986.1 uncharacterized protein LOC110353943 isoform X2 [Anas platyrhynchos]